MDYISIIVPCFNEQEVLPIFYKDVCRILDSIDYIKYELLFVDDGSHDKTLKIIKDFAKVNKNVKFISFSRNFGKEAAMYAGLTEAKGDYIAIMDADMQDPPELLLEMYSSLKSENIDCVCARRADREGEGRIRSFLSNAFYSIIDKLSNTEMVKGARDYRMMTRQMVDSVISMKEYNRYSKGLFSFVGYETKWIDFKNVKRAAGETKWSIFALMKYAKGGLISFSSVPLVISSYCGLLSCFIAFVLGIYIAIKTMIFGNPTDGWTTLVCIILFIGGLQMLFLGIIGQYLSKTYMETKDRPIYFTKDSNIDEQSGKYICYCNHVTEQDIIDAIKNGAITVEAIIEETGAMKNSNCEVNNPKGSCCYSDIVNVFKKHI